ncbi:MAG: hypothetical protein ACHQ50_15840 [Fimbriimonadales bacterium]
MLLTLTAQNPADMPTRIMADFGYPGFRPAQSRKTSSGGWEFVQGTTTLTVDAQGRPRWLAIKNVRFERSDAKAARAKIARLLAKYPLRLPEGKWVTERFLAPDPYGSASSSMRYFFVPVLHGYPFLGAEMTVQFSAGLDRVLEWAHHPWPAPSAALPAKILSRAAGLKAFEAIGRTWLAAHPGGKVYVKRESLQIVWLRPRHPILAYEGWVQFSTPPTEPRHAYGGGFLYIDASSGLPIVLQ